MLAGLWEKLICKMENKVLNRTAWCPKGICTLQAKAFLILRSLQTPVMAMFKELKPTTAPSPARDQKIQAGKASVSGTGRTQRISTSKAAAALWARTSWTSSKAFTPNLRFKKSARIKITNACCSFSRTWKPAKSHMTKPKMKTMATEKSNFQMTLQCSLYTIALTKPQHSKSMKMFHIWKS